ncbi:MAG: bacterial Ig-like domain-containing protein [Bacilli bacterium]|nr:bacterial Ig-like domain-containing protein [Bacilli bacterium]
MKHKGYLFGIGGLLSIVAVAVAGFNATGGISISSIIHRLNSNDPRNYSATISRETGTLVTRLSDYNYTSTVTSGGTTFYLRNVNGTTISLESSYVAIMPGTTDSPSKDPEITFTTGNASATNESLFEFQHISSISMTSDKTSRNLDVYTSSDGSSWTSAGTIASAGGTNTSVDGAKYVKITYSGMWPAYINTLTINYSCSNSPSPVVVKTLNSISVTGATTEYTVGDEFDFDGTVTATYSDESVATVSPTSVTKPDMSSAGEKTITVSYTEGGITRSDEYVINVSEEGEDTFQYTIYSYRVEIGTGGVYHYLYSFTFNQDGTATYTRKTTNGTFPNGAITASMNLKFTINESNVITLTFVNFGTKQTTSGTGTTTNSDYSNLRISSSTPVANTTKITGNYANGVFSVTLYNYSSQNTDATNFSR